MSERKVVSRNLAIAFGMIIVIVFLASLWVAIEYYAALVDHKDFEMSTLQDNIKSLEAPELIGVNLRADDNRPLSGTPYLHVYGEVCNIGTDTAYNCSLVVTAYTANDESLTIVAVATLGLGTITGESWTVVDANIYYSGSALACWDITPTWRTTPLEE